MARPVRPIPEGYHAVTPYLIIDGAAQAIEFYKKALGAESLDALRDIRKQWKRNHVAFDESDG